MPKSPSPAVPSAVSQMLSGLTSRCTTSCAWAWASASATVRPVRSTSVDGHPAAGCGGEGGGQRAALHEAHDDVQLLADVERVEDRDHVRVVAEPRHQTRLAPHALPDLLARRAGDRPRDGDGPLERQVVRQPHLLGAPAAEHPLRPVAPGDELRRVVRRGGRGRGEGVLVVAAGPARVVAHGASFAARGDRIHPEGVWVRARMSGSLLPDRTTPHVAVAPQEATPCSFPPTWHTCWRTNAGKRPPPPDPAAISSAASGPPTAPGSGAWRCAS